MPYPGKATRISRKEMLLFKDVTKRERGPGDGGEESETETGRETETQRQRHTDTYRDRQSHTQTYTDRQTDRQKAAQANLKDGSHANPCNLNGSGGCNRRRDGQNVRTWQSSRQRDDSQPFSSITPGFTAQQCGDINIYNYIKALP